MFFLSCYKWILTGYNSLVMWVLAFSPASVAVWHVRRCIGLNISLDASCQEWNGRKTEKYCKL